MSKLAYTMKSRTGDAQPAARSSQETETNDWMSEEEMNEAYNIKTKTQIKLDPLQVCLFPTYLSLLEDVLQEDLRDSLQDLVSQELFNEYGKDFVYFAVTDAKIDWHSGEESNREYGHNSNKNNHKNAQVIPSSQAEPYTCALFSGATVMFHQNGAMNAASNAIATQELLEPKITEVLQEKLVESLRNSQDNNSSSNNNNGDDRSRPFYTELKGTSVSWTAAKRQQGGMLVYLDKSINIANDQSEQLLETPVVEEIPETVVLDESLEDSTVINVVGVNALEGSESQQQQDSQANAFSTTRGMILASTLGALLLVVLVVIFCVMRRKKQERRTAAEGDGKDTSTVISHDEVDEEIARSGRRGGRRKNRGDSNNSVSPEADDESEAAQYKSNGNTKLLDCISVQSVGSEWTLTTGVTDGVSSALGAGSTSNKTMAEMLAAKETFDRDRQITLQKDMLQSEWFGAVVSPSGLAHSRSNGQSSPYSNPSKSSKSSRITTIASGDANGGLQFEEATGEGEEIFLMQPAR